MKKLLIIRLIIIFFMACAPIAAASFAKPANIKKSKSTTFENRDSTNPPYDPWIIHKIKQAYALKRRNESKKYGASTTDSVSHTEIK